ncbi:MAG: hypothetical protein ACI9UK_001170 [Candidatus Krumholzibacteriia bacterium]|jgi:hypothetical protein
MRLTVLVLVCLFAGVVHAQITDIGDIQNYNADGAPSSPDSGQTVIIAGNIVVESGALNGALLLYIDDSYYTFQSSASPSQLGCQNE